MNAIYTDLHIHTSENADKLKFDYDYDLLIKKIKEYTNQSQCLISVTDHNVINEDVYMNIKNYDADISILVGVELHLKNIGATNFFHCHIYFSNMDYDLTYLKSINLILKELYPLKTVTKDTDDIPSIETIISKFEDYDFVLLPHGGQNHAPFHKSKSKDSVVDNAFERVTYYNFLHGFTSRSNRGLEDSIKYFKKLGINEFTNLITCTDNYSPARYPDTKAKQASEFVPTWLLSEPSFLGLKLALTERDRLVYSRFPEVIDQVYISSIKLKNDKIDIDVELSEGLNVIIGGSSSGKSLLVDTIVREKKNELDTSDYKDFKLDNIEINNPSSIEPHYLNQNYIATVISKETDLEISSIPIIQNLFPQKGDIRSKINEAKAVINDLVSKLITASENIETIQSNLKKIPSISSLALINNVEVNHIDCLLPNNVDRNRITFTREKYTKYSTSLSELQEYLMNNKLVNDTKGLKDAFELVLRTLNIAYDYSIKEEAQYNFIASVRKIIQDDIEVKSKVDLRIKTDIEYLINNLKQYKENITKYNNSLFGLCKYTFNTEGVEVTTLAGHKINIRNTITITKEKLRILLNKYLRTSIKDVSDILPEDLFSNNHKKKSPKIKDYNDLIKKLQSDLTDNIVTYKITTKDKKDFDNLSPGWKSAVILDIALSYKTDRAPIIIDQPEDNLANQYINKELVNAIKASKKNKQLIIVTHNATIPMLGDAQQVILCDNTDGFIKIRSSKLEGKIDGKNVLDIIAKITDGGKRAIKKRFKKYDIKTYREDVNETKTR